MSGIPRTGRQPGTAGSPAARPARYLDRQGMGAGLGAVVNPLSFWQIADIPFAARVAAPERWRLAGHDGQLRLGRRTCWTP